MVTKPRMKTITLHLDYETWKTHNETKTKREMTWDAIVDDWFEREKRGEFE